MINSQRAVRTFIRVSLPSPRVARRYRNLLLDVCDNISPGMVWPPKQTTICPLGQSATPSIASVVRRFPEEFERYLGTSFTTTVPLGGAAYMTKPTAGAGAPGGAAQ